MRVLFLVHSSVSRVVTQRHFSCILCFLVSLAPFLWWVTASVCVCEWCRLYQSWPLLAGAPCVCVSHTLSPLSCYSTEAESCWQTHWGNREGCKCMCKEEGGLGCVRWGGKSAGSGKTKGRGLLWRHSLPHTVTLSTWHDLSHMEGRRMPFNRQMDTHVHADTQTNSHKTHVLTSVGPFPPSFKTIYNPLPPSTCNSLAVSLNADALQAPPSLAIH